MVEDRPGAVPELPPDAPVISAAWAVALVEHSAEAMMVADENTVITYASQAVTAMFGYRSQDVVGRSGFDFIHPEDLDLASEALANTLVRPGVNIPLELRIRHNEGHWCRCEMVVVNLLANPVLPGLAVYLRDVTQRRAMEDELVRQALHDGLTGLANRTLFLDHLERALAASVRTHTMVAVLYADLDLFKAVNDTFGHAAGDEVLVAVSERLRSLTRAGDTVARLGGDEFGLVYVGLADPAVAEELAERLVAGLRTPFTVRRQQIRVTASVGVVVAEPGARVDGLLNDVDRAMYEAKQRSSLDDPGFVAAHAGISTPKHSVAQELDAALSGGELSLQWRPLVDLATDRVVAVEAVPVRSARGLRPEDARPALQELRSGAALDRFRGWLVGTTELERSSLERSLGWAPPVSVALPGRWWADSELAASVAAGARSGAGASVLDGSPSRSGTEGRPPLTVLLAMPHPSFDVSHLHRVVEDLGHLGVGVVLDGLGVTYAVFPVLRLLPVVAVRVDLARVAPPSSDEGRAMLAALAATGRVLHFEVIADGVTTDAERSVLAGLGCATGQGPNWGPLLTTAEASAALRQT